MTWAGENFTLFIVGENVEVRDVCIQNVVRFGLVTCVEGERAVERERRQRVRRNTNMCLRDLPKLLYVVKGLTKYLHVAFLCLATAARLCK